MGVDDTTDLLHEENILDEELLNKTQRKIRQIYNQIRKRRNDKDETLNNAEFNRYLQEEIDVKLSCKYLTALQQNLIYYAVIFVFIGLPLWWVTTSPYRAVLQSIDPSIQHVYVPINLTFHYERNISVEILKLIVAKLSEETRELQINAKFREIKKGAKFDDSYSLNIVVLTQKSFSKSFPNMDSQTRGYFEGKDVLTINFVDADSLFKLLSRVLDTQRLKSISDLKLQRNLSVWDRIPIATLYHLQIVFLHDEGAQDETLQMQIIQGAKKISAFVSEFGLLVDVSAVHLWDFDVASFTTTTQSNRKSLNIQEVESLTTEVDKYVNWMGVGIAQPLIKMAVFMVNEKIEFLNSQNRAFNGFAIVSWGGISALNLNDSSSVNPALYSIFDTLKTQFNVRPIEFHWQVAFEKERLAHEFEWQRFQMQSFREHIQIASTALQSMHTLKQKIENLVVSKEVAIDVYEAHEVLMATLLQAKLHSKIDIHGAIRARILAERAVKHPSTLKHLNFPMEQRYAIYVPLFLPVFIHLVTATWHMLSLIPAVLRRCFWASSHEDVIVDYFPYLF